MPDLEANLPASPQHTIDTRFPHMVDVIGTHYDGCYKGHPVCAYDLGRADTVNLILAWMRNPELWKNPVALIEELAEAIEEGAPWNEH